MSASGWLTLRYVCKQLAHIQVCLQAAGSHSGMFASGWLTFRYV
jgi:hypothetical protein